MSATSIDLVNATIAEMSELLRRREVSPVELTEATLERIDRVAPQLGCFVTVTGERCFSVKCSFLTTSEVQ